MPLDIKPFEMHLGNFNEFHIDDDASEAGASTHTRTKKRGRVGGHSENKFLKTRKLLEIDIDDSDIVEV